MSRFHYFTVLAWLVASVLALGWAAPRPADALASIPHLEPVDAGTPEGWFRRIKPLCNSLEVEMATRTAPPPAGLEGTGYAAACFAIAGRIDAARGLIAGLEPNQRWKAAAIVFDIGHPIADAGDDRSAGPIMSLVVEFWPNHYMALYHAGMANYAIGESRLARQQLEAFLEQYKAEDGWRANAVEVLGRFSQ
jgi:hypothetical protein